MKKILLFLLTLFICSNVYALDLTVINEQGVTTEENGETITIPFQTNVRLLDDMEGKEEALVEYNGKSLTIKKTDLKVLEEEFKPELGTPLGIEETIKVFSNNKVYMYKGPSKEFYGKLDKSIPAEAELTYKVVYTVFNEDTYAYVTYDGVSGWILLDLTSNDMARKLSGKIIIINPNNIEVKDSIKGSKVNKEFTENQVLNYQYVTKYQYGINDGAWLSITDANAIATESDTKVLNLILGDVVYEKPNGEKTLSEVAEPKQANAVFYYNGYYYVEFDGIQGWVKKDVADTNSAYRIEVSEKKEPVTPEPVPEKEEPEHKVPTKVELIIIISLAVLLLLSLTSLIAVVIMNKKTGKELQKNMSGTSNTQNNG